ncbi:MAG: aminopeptidase, partial [Alphaproteobacteria bacterium]
AKLTFVTFENKGGLVTPLPLRIRYADGSEEEVRLPAEIWRHDPRRVTKLFVTEKEIVGVIFDPHHETGDADEYDNAWPRRPEEIRLRLTKPAPRGRNLMKEMKQEKAKDEGGGQ